MEFCAFGPFRGVTGYDVVVRNFIQGWNNNLHNFKLLEFGQWSNFRAQTDIDPILEQAEKVNVSNPEFFINFCLLDQTRLETTLKNVCYTMFEADSICSQWVEAANALDLIVVPSEFNRQSFAKGGIPLSKLAVCPVPLNIEKIKAPPIVKSVSFRDKDLTQYKHRYLNCSEFVPRKNIEGLLRAWTTEMKPEDDACLVLKLNSNSGLKLDWLSEKIAKFTKNKNCAPVFIITDLMTESAMLGLYHWCTHYVTLSYGEGWGMSESICGVLGKAIIAPKHTAFTEYLDDSTAYLVNSQQVPCQTDGAVARYYSGLRWFAPINFSAIKALRASLSDDGTKGKLLSERLCKMCDMNVVAEKLLRIINEQSYVRTSKPTIPEDKKYSLAMFCKSLGQGSRCGIADYTTNLFKGVSSENKVSGVLANGEPIYYHSVLDKFGVSIAHVQLEYQFMSPKRLELFIKFCLDSGIKPVITLHTVNPTAWSYHAVLQKYKPTICVSSNLMRSKLLTDCGLSHMSDNIFVVPMGMTKDEVVVPAPRKDARPLIGFFGFCYFHKGIDRIIRLAKDHPEMDFMIHSAKPANDSGYWDRCRALIPSEGNIKWDDRYRSEKDIVTDLATCNAIFLPYMEYGGVGVSAAIRTCLKAGAPILALDNSFFRDCVFGSGLVKFVGDDPVNYEQWSKNFVIEVNNIMNDPTIAINYVQSRDKFVESYSWEKVADIQRAVYEKICGGN